MNKTKYIAIIDYGMGNLHSVEAACKKVGMRALITSQEDEILCASAAILPGVGAFSQAMKNMHNSKLDLTIKKFFYNSKPLIGICLGMQLFFSESEEFGNTEGLGLIKGKVKKFNFKNNKMRIPVPQIGWNRIKNISQNGSWTDSLLENNDKEDFMYFIHSYYVEPVDKKIILSSTKYGDIKYCSALKYRNITAFQFHPEKSGPSGIKIYLTLKNSLSNV